MPLFKSSQKYKNLSLQMPNDFSPITSLIQNLQSLYSHIFLTFYNPLTPEIIGLIFLPSVKSGIFDARYSKFMEQKEGGKCGINVDQVLEEVKEVGKGIVVSSRVYMK